VSDRANDKQVGGDHYRSDIQHWDVIALHSIGYLEGCATKYVTRHRSKNGVQDLQKAEHYAQKLYELRMSHNLRPTGLVPLEIIEKFISANNLGPIESEIIRILFRWDNADQLGRARQLIHALLGQEQALAKED